MSRKEWDPNLFEMFAWFFALWMLVAFIDQAWDDEPPPNIEAETGICMRPTPQGGC